MTDSTERLPSVPVGYMTAVEVAAHFGVTRTTVAAWTTSGKLRATKQDTSQSRSGWRYLFAIETVELFATKRQIEAMWD